MKKQPLKYQITFKQFYFSTDSELNINLNFKILHKNYKYPGLSKLPTFLNKQ